jgi:transposase InsO family protein
VKSLYQKVKARSKGCRDSDVRIKLNLFLLALKLGNVSEACARFGFSRQFYYKWWTRFERSKLSLASLCEKSRRPRRSPNRTPHSVEKAIRYYSARHYGARQIEAHLKREGDAMKRSRTTICHILNGRKKRRLGKRARLKTHQKRYELVIPGQRLQMDVKYVPYEVDGQKAYSYVIIDECTRWRFAHTFLSLDAGTTVVFLEMFLRVCPFPVSCIQTDNGQEFTYRLNPVMSHREHPVDTWCNAKSIRHRLIPPGVKELNGKVERSHRIDMQYFYWKAPSHDLQKFIRAQYFWIGFYNAHRLHGGIGYLTPLEKLSERRKTLQMQSQPTPELEALRLKFLAGQPKELNQQDRQIQALEQELQRLLKIVA